MPIHSTKEIWKDIPDYEGEYQVSNLGRVKSLKKRYFGKILKPIVKPDGYLYVNLHKDGIKKHKMLHALVLTAFIGPCPTGMEGCHFPDRSPKNNTLPNLRWDTRSSNSMDRVVHGTSLRGKNHFNVKLTEKNVRLIRRLALLAVEMPKGKRGNLIKKIANEFNITPDHVRAIRSKRRWTYLW